MSWRDAIYMTRARAVALGATHEGIHFGVPHWVWLLDESNLDEMGACPKIGLLEWWVTLCCHAHAFINSLRDPEDQVDFAFAIKRISAETEA